MPKASDSLINYLYTVAGAWRDDPRDDAELLARYADNGDETAFKSLVWRHGPMVWQTCKRVLGNGPDAEDAFQVTFLTLTRKAGRLQRQPLAGWLYSVARRRALDSNIAARRRRKLEHQSHAAVKLEEKDASRTELSVAIDEELTGLPEKLRIPLVLYYLEEKTQSEVARILGCSCTAAQKRLAKGETALRERLERRGLTLGTGSMGMMLGNKADVSALPAGLIAKTAQAALAFRSGTLTGTSAEAVEKLLHSLSLKGVMRKNWWVVMICVGVLGIGRVGLVAWRMFGDNSDQKEPESSVTLSAPGLSVKPHSERVDLYGDPLPEEAIARIGTIRFRGQGESNGSWKPNDARCNYNLNANVGLSSDGKTLVMADGVNIYFWDTVTGKQLYEIAMEKCERVTLSPDGKLLAAECRGIKSGCIQLLEIATGKPVGEPLQVQGWKSVFTPDGKTVVTYSCENLRHIKHFNFYDVGTRKLLRRNRVNPKLEGYDLISAQFSSDGRFLACVHAKYSDDKLPAAVVEMMDVKTGNNLATLEYQQEVVQLALSPEGNIITGGKDKVIRIWDVKTGKEIRQLGVMDRVPTVMAFLPDGKTLLVACAGQVRFWDVATSSETRPALACPGLLRPILLSADGTKLIEQIGYAVSMWDVATGKETGPSAGAPRSFMRNLAFSPDSSMLATDAEKIAGIVEGLVDESFGIPLQKPGMAAINLYESATGKQIGSLLAPSSDDIKGGIQEGIFWPLRNTILARGVYIGANMLEKQVLTQWKITSTASAVKGNVVHLANEETWQWRIELLDIATGKKLPAQPFLDLNFNFNAIAFSVDHRILVSQPTYPGSDLRDSPISLWETSTGHKLSSFDLPAIAGGNPGERPKFDKLVGISPNGRLIATCNPETFTISLWEHVSGKARWHLPMPAGCKSIPTVAFSPDSSRLATGCSIGPQEKKSIHVWDLTTGQECQCFHGHRSGSKGDPPNIVFSPDGRRLASAGLDYTVLIWGVKQTPSLEKASQPLDQKELQVLKSALGCLDAVTAYRAIGKLRQVPDQAVSLAAECLRPQIPSPQTERIAREVNLLIGELDSNDFQSRMEALEKLRKTLSTEDEPIAQSMLSQTLLEGKLSVEVRKSVTKLLAELTDERKLGGVKTLELLRMFRAIELLESIHNKSAREVLQKVVTASPRPEVGQEAETALKRLSRTPYTAMP